MKCVQASGVGLLGLTAQSHVEVVGKDEQELVFYPVQERNYNESGVLGTIIKQESVLMENVQVQKFYW